MTPESITPTSPEPQGMGEFSRLVGVYLEPTKAFTDIARRPTWLVPLVLVILSGIAFFAIFGQHVGWARYLQHQLETNPKAAERMAQLPPEQRARTEEMQIKFAPVGADAVVAIFIPIALVVSAGVVLLVVNAMGAGLRYKQIFSIMAYGSLPIIVKYALAVVVMFLKNPDDFNPTNPLAFNAAAFMDPVTASKFLYSIATAVDLFAIWSLLLDATGLKAAAQKRLTFGGALFAVATPYVFFALAGATLAGLFA
ncbi:MAG TPA: YIP1 family protein [Bryobacteraceae bacterium]|nr:YIP1 family protein [Bryobacteraceae bacterium]